VTACAHWRPNFEVDYDFRDLPGMPTWTFRLDVALRAPSLLGGPGRFR